MPKGRPFQEPTPEEIQEVKERFIEEITNLVNGDISSLQEMIAENPEAQTAYDSLTDEQKEGIRWQTVAARVMFVIAIIEKQSPWEVAGQLAGSLMQGEAMAAEIFLQHYAENN
jgi:broad specificity phosphatase PhoE